MTVTLSDYERPPRILRLNLAGHPVDWVTWSDAVCLYARNIVTWTLGDTVMRVRGGQSRVDGCQSSINLHGIIACSGRIVPAARSVPPLTNQTLFGRDGNLCLYCGGVFADSDLTRDHVVPLSLGGQDTWDNVVASCKRCNHHKGSRLLDECAIELLALPYAPNFAEYLALSNSGRILGDQMEFLKKSFSANSRLR